MTPPPDPSARPRLDHVDGLRAVAIFWVALYHYAYFWTPAGKGTNLLPYGDVVARTPLADVGYLGVYLFFIVSGFVIAMSLTRSKSIGEFALNRVIRLWPALIICGTITFALTSFFGPDQLRRSPLEYLISLTFVPPPHVGKLLGIGGLEWLDGAYWSLWTEVRFYFIAAVLYFSMRRHFILLWTLFAFASTGVHVMGSIAGGSWDALARLLFTAHQPFFTAGIALASLRFGHLRWPRWLLTFAIVQAFTFPALAVGGLTDHTAAGLILVFVLAVPVMLSPGPVPVLSSRAFATVGVASYAYYLLHQNAGIALLQALHDQRTDVMIFIMIATQIGLVLFSIGLTKWVEEPLRRALRRKRTPSSAQLRQA